MVAKQIFARSTLVCSILIFLVACQPPMVVGMIGTINKQNQVKPSMVGTWQTEKGGTIRVFENKTYSVKCSEGDANYGKTSNWESDSVYLRGFHCLPQGLRCNYIAQSHSWQSVESKLDFMETSANKCKAKTGSDLRVNYNKGICQTKLCALRGSESNLPASLFVKESDDPNFDNKSN